MSGPPRGTAFTAVHHELTDASSRGPEALSLPFEQLGLSDAELSRELLRPQVIGEDPLRWSGADVLLFEQRAQYLFEQGALALEGLYKTAERGCISGDCAAR